MSTSFTVRLASREDLASLPNIEVAAASQLLSYAPEIDLSYVTSPAEFEEAMMNKLLWVAESAGDPVGFGLVDMLSVSHPHLEELDVLPSFQRQGVGTALVQGILDWLALSPHAQITLSTFKDVPWNAPFYRRLGFKDISPEEFPSVLADLVEVEAAHGLDPAKRVAMIYRTD